MGKCVSTDGSRVSGLLLISYKRVLEALGIYARHFPPARAP